jgi:integrase
MSRKSKGPWRRKSGGWWVWHENKQLWLADTKDEAWRAWHLLQAGEPIYTGPNPFREVANAYVKFLTRTRSERHARDARLRLDQFVQPWWNRAASSLRWPDVEDVLKSKSKPRKVRTKTGKERILPPWNPTTQAGYLIALRGCLRWATKTRLLAENPIPHISIPRSVSRQDALTEAQVESLIKHGGRLKDLLWCMSVTGARPGELIKATVEQCDVDGTAIRLRESKVGRRIIYLPKDCRKKMASIRKRRKSGPLFPAPKGGHWTQTKFFEEFRAAKEKSKLPEWASAYTLRHTWITQRLRGEKKLTMDDVAALAGTSVNMIERTYKHLSDGDVKNIADRL